MEKTARMLDVLDRAYSGPLVDEKEFDLRVVAGGVARVIKQYGIKFDRRRIIQYDDDLVDRLFQAAVDFLSGSGIFHKGTQRLITFTRAEVEQAARQGPDEIIYGEGADARVWRRRTVGDPRPPHISGGPIGTPLSEDQWISIMQSYWQEPLIDLVVPGTLATSFGREVRSRSAYEIVASWQEARCGLEAARRAGRPGLARMCVEMAISDIGHLSSISRGGFSASDVHVIPLISEMKTNDELLNKVAHSIEQDGVILGFYNPILGGLGGPAEGVAVLIVAGFLALQMIYFPHSVESCPTHPFNSNSTDPHILRAVSAACAALARNTNLFTEFMTSPISGPCTPSLLYECIAMAATASSCGASRVLGVRSAVGVVPNHCTGLEARWNGEVARAAAGLGREQADEIVRRAVAEYQDLLGTKPVGVPFDEAYDPTTLQPRAEWAALYDQVAETARQWGLPLEG